MACYKGFYYVCAGMIYKLQGFSIKIFFDFEIEIGFDRGMIAINQCFFFLFVWLICSNRGGGYTSRSRGGVSAENSDKNKKALFQANCCQYNS
jgi:hypothetical protein